MEEKILLVDYENVQQVELDKVNSSFRIVIFVGATQKSIPIDLVARAQVLGSQVEWRRVDGNGSNALDFFIACELGRVLEKAPSSRCIVLSRDKGFDPLLRYLVRCGLKCKRINSLIELDPAAKPAETPNYQRVVELLGKSEKKVRPRRRKTLSQHIASMFQKKIEQAEVERIIDMLFANKLISESNNTIAYAF